MFCFYDEEGWEFCLHDEEKARVLFAWWSGSATFVCIIKWENFVFMMKRGGEFYLHEEVGMFCFHDEDEARILFS